MIEQLLAGSLDGGLCATPLASPGIFETQLAEEPFVAYLPPGDPLSKRSRLSQKDLATRPLWVMPEGHCFRTQVLSYCKAERPVSPSGVEFESGSFETLIRLVDGGMGATVLPELVAANLPPLQQAEQVRALTGPKPVREIGLVTARRDYRRRVSEALGLLVQEKLKASLGKKGGRREVLSPLA
jgi:LysR family hydrogen peroxide-inducible transcriptional activator